MEANWDSQVFQAVGCFGVPQLHCGPSTSFFEVRPGQPSPAQLAPGLGPELDYHWKRWSLGAALFLNGLVPFGKVPAQPPAELSGTIFACLGQSFGALNGLCAGPLLAFPPANPKAFTWKQDLGLVFSASPDLLQFITTTVAQL